MAQILPVSTNRTSELLVQQRLLSQLNGSQTDMLKLETQISTGQRLQLPSDDASSALRAISIQQLLDRKTQISSNLSISQSFLSANDSALSQISNLLTSATSTAQSVVGAVATDQQRSAAADQVGLILQQLVNAGNQQFRGRFLFGGSNTDSPPFQLVNNSVMFNGNTNALSSFADTDLLLPTNVDPNAVFGTLSSGVQGTTDVNPTLTDSTRLSDLNLGKGVAAGSVAISDGTNTSIVNLSGAQTIGDVISLLQNHPPGGRTLTATLTATGLNLSLDSAGGGTLKVNEVGSGTTAHDLGILAPNGGQGTGPLIGADVNPQLTGDTPLANLLGTRASVTLTSSGAGNDIVLQARQNGSALNGVAVSIVNNPTLGNGQEIVNYDPNTKALTVQIAAGQSTAKSVVNAINNNPVASQLFQASLSTHDTGAVLDANTSLATVTNAVHTSGGSGIALDQQSGFQIVNNGTTYTIDISGAKTVAELLNTINGSPAGALATINAQGTGINVQSRQSGVDFSIGENGGATATQLGIRSFTQNTNLADLNHGLGVHALGTGPDFLIQRPDGINLSINVSGAKTIGDVINLINNHPANQDPQHAVTARLAASGNGIELVSTDTATIAPLKVIEQGGSQAAEDLGLVPVGANSSQPANSAGGTTTLTGRDVNPGQVNGIFTALVRLQQALKANDDEGIGNALAMVTSGSQQVTLARANVGARQQDLDSLSSGLDTQVNALKDSLSHEADTDLPAAITDLTSKQAAFQASLQTAAMISRLTILNYL